MNDKRFLFLSGLPRSGSTVLASILSQNPSFYVSPISILVGIFDSIRKIWATAEHPKVFPVKDQFENVLRGAAEGLYKHIDKPIIIDKNRAWAHPTNLEILEKTFKTPPKIICTVRNITDILASFLKIIHQSSMTSFVDKELIEQNLPVTDENRCTHLMSKNGHVFQAWSVLQWGYTSPFKNCLHFIEYEDLVNKPSTILNKLYDFLEIESYKHDLNSIENSSQEEDSLYGIPGMHNVRKDLKKVKYSVEDILGLKLYHRYLGGDFWRVYKNDT